MSTALKPAPKKVITGEVRASYVNIFKTRFNDLSGKEEYSMMILIQQVLRKGEPLGGRSRPENDFEVEEQDDMGL